MNSNAVEAYIDENSHFKEGLIKLRDIICSTELEETIKWRIPVYTLKGKNVVGIGAFKNHFGLWFFNGVYLKDPHNVLINAQKNKTKALRQMRFSTQEEIDAKVVLEYIREAIENQRLGKELRPETVSTPVVIPIELKSVLAHNEALQIEFNRLSLSKQRNYCDYVRSAKRATTKQIRIEKIKPLILKGVGLYDNYKRSK